MSRNASRPQGPLPVPTTQLARTLIRLHARLRGELLKHSQGEPAFVEAERAAQTLAHIEAVIRFLDVPFDPAAIRPLRTRPHTGPLGHGDLRAETLAALRWRDDWMTYTEIAATIIEKRRLRLDDDQYQHFLQKLREATHMLKGQGAVIPEQSRPPGNFPSPQRWRLAPMLRR